MTKQEIRKSIIACAAELKHVPSLEELLKMTPVSHRHIIKHFGGYIAALRDTGLELRSTIGRGHGVTMENLFTDWAGVVQKLKKLPSMNEYSLLSQYSPYPLMRRFGKWRQVPHGLKQFAEKSGLAEEWKAELELVLGPPPVSANGLVKPCLLLPDRLVYGAPMFPGPMAYAPVNEMGVVFLFGWMAPQLGYVVHWLQSEFPDCELMRRVGEDKSQPLKAEIEYESRNFLKHMHDVKGCDMIICWRHNWPECPLEVLELKRLLPRLHDYQPPSHFSSAEQSCDPKS